MSEAVKELEKVENMLTPIKTPTELPTDPYEYGEKLNAAYQKGWSDAKKTIFEILETQKALSAPKKAGIFD